MKLTPQRILEPLTPLTMDSLKNKLDLTEQHALRNNCVSFELLGLNIAPVAARYCCESVDHIEWDVSLEFVTVRFGMQRPLFQFLPIWVLACISNNFKVTPELLGRVYREELGFCNHCGESGTHEC